PGQPFAVMELLEGRRLSDFMGAGKALDVGRARRWALALGGAVERLHNTGLAHGRLRPRNVMVFPDGRVKLMDVEVVGLLDTSTPPNVLDLDLSPAEYLSPEQIRRAPVTEKTDIYAFATIVYEMFAGAPTNAPPAPRRTESAANPSAPAMGSAPPTAVTPATVAAPARTPTPTPSAEARVALAPAAPVSPAKEPREPVKATPPAAPSPPMVASVRSGSLGSAPVLAEVQSHRRTYRVGWLDSGQATAQHQQVVKQAF